LRERERAGDEKRWRSLTKKRVTTEPKSRHRKGKKEGKRADSPPKKLTNLLKIKPGKCISVGRVV
jgi:hypothetical protein